MSRGLNILLLSGIILVNFFALVLLGIYFNNQTKTASHTVQLASSYFMCCLLTILCFNITSQVRFVSESQILTIRNALIATRDKHFRAYYAMIIVNLLYLITFCGTIIESQVLLSYKDMDSYFTLVGYFVSAYTYFLFSKDILYRETLLPNEQFYQGEGVIRCSYETSYYVIGFLVLLSYYFNVQEDSIPGYILPLSPLLIANLTFAIFSLTKVAFIVNFFLVICFGKVLKTSITDLISSDEILQSFFLAFILMNSLFNIMKILHNYYTAYQNVIHCRLRLQINANEPIDYLIEINNLPRRPLPPPRVNEHSEVQHQRDFLFESEIDQLKVITLQTILDLSRENKKSNSFQIDRVDNEVDEPQQKPSLQMARNNLIVNQLKNKQPIQRQVIQSVQHEEIKPIVSQKHQDEMSLPIQIQQFEQNMSVQVKRQQDLAAEQKECPVCNVKFNKNEQVLILRCEHLFHKECLVPWLKMKNSCPLCRRPVLDIQQVQQP